MTILIYPTPAFNLIISTYYLLVLPQLTQYIATANMSTSTHLIYTISWC